MLLAENTINLRRLELEQARLKKLVEAKVQDEGERRRAGGDANPVDASKEWPNLFDFSEGTPQLNLKARLERGGKFGDLLGKIKGDKAWEKKRPKNFDPLMEMFNKRREQMEIKG